MLFSRIMKEFRAVGLALFAVALSGCVGGGPAQSAASAELTQVERVPYLLGPGDQLRILVYGEGDLSGQFTVGPQGTIAYPLLGELKAAGMTPEQFAEFLTRVLQPNYVRKPNVSAEVLNYRPYFILGEVNSPGTYPFVNGLTVVNAVATASGFSYRADSQRVFIKHENEVNEREYRLTSITPVQPGDTIRISERRF